MHLFFIPSCAFQNHQYRYSVYFCRKIAKEAKVNFGAYISEMTHSRWRNLSIAPFGIYITFMATDLHFFETCLSNRCDIHIRSHGTVIIIFARRNDLEDKLCSGLHSPHISHFLHLPHFHFLHLWNFQKPSHHFNIPYIHYIQSPHLSFSILFLCTAISVILSNPIPATYLIFVIFFTLIHFESWKFYTRKVRKFTTNLPRDKTAFTECKIKHWV